VKSWFDKIMSIADKSKPIEQAAQNPIGLSASGGVCKKVVF